MTRINASSRKIAVVLQDELGRVPKEEEVNAAPGQTHEGLRSYYWGAFREGTGAKTLRDPAKGGVSEQIVERSEA